MQLEQKELLSKRLLETILSLLLTLSSYSARPKIPTRSDTFNLIAYSDYYCI